jgi:ribonuclease HI
MKITCFIDGASRGNPGMAGAGIALFAENGESICQKYFALGVATNNEAEYNALLRALETSATLGATHVHVKSDSELWCVK